MKHFRTLRKLIFSYLNVFNYNSRILKYIININLNAEILNKNYLLLSPYEILSLKKEKFI
jgi:hypothetical protein